MTVRELERAGRGGWVFLRLTTLFERQRLPSSSDEGACHMIVGTFGRRKTSGSR
jgi:hypothetical protein